MTNRQLARNAAAAALAIGFVLGTAGNLHGRGLVQADRPPVPQPPSAQPARALTPLRVTIVISRVQGEKKTGNLPFTLWVNANDRQATSLRMMSDVPIPITTLGTTSGSTTNPVTSYQYRSIGTSIDCGAESLDDGRFRLNLSVQDSQIFSDAMPTGQTSPGLPRLSIQSFTSTTAMVLRDGQTAQYTTASDKASGEVVRVDVTVNVVK